MSADGKVLSDWDADGFRTMIVDDLIKEVRVTIRPVILGGRDAQTMTGVPSQEGDFFLLRERFFRLKEVHQENDEAHLVYVRRKSQKGVDA